MGNEAVASEQIRTRKFRLTVEPIVFVFLTASIVQSIVIQNLYLDKVCQVNLKLNASQCALLNETSQLVDEVQRHVAQLNIYASLLENIPAIFCVLFLGPWSNQNGRKLLMVLPVIGHMVSVSLYITNYLMFAWPAEYILLASAPLGFFGGNATMFMACCSYISDITDNETRTSRMSLLYAAMTISFPAGLFASIYLFSNGGYLAIWGTSLGLASLALLFTFFFITDSRGQKSASEINNDGSNQRSAVTSLDSSDNIFSNIWGCIVTTFQSRPGYKRITIVLLLAGMTLFVFCQVASGVTYLYVRKKFSWDEPDYAAYSASVSSIAGLGSLLLLPLLSSYFKIADCPLGILALVARMGASIVYSVAATPLMMYLGSSGIILSSAISAVIRSMLSKQVPADELGQVFSVLASLESIVPLMSSSTYNLVYEATLDWFPGCVYLVEAGCLLVIIFLLIWVMILQYRDRNLQPAPYTSVDATPVEIL